MACNFCNKYRSVDNFNYCPMCGVKFREGVNYIINPFHMSITQSTPKPKEKNFKNISTNNK